MQLGSTDNIISADADPDSATPQDAAPRYPWFALRTRSNLENLAAVSLTHKGFNPYLPTFRTRRRWSDRVVIADQPLFRGYVFCRFDPLNRMPILTTHGVISIISCGMEPAPIDEIEIRAVQTVLRSNLATEPCPFIREGQKVRVLRGALTGIDGILVKKKSDFVLVISIEMLQRSVAVEIDREWVSIR